MSEHRPRFLILRGGAIGDFVLTLPVLQALRERWPDAYIELVGYPHIAILAKAAGYVDRVESLDRARIARFFSLRPDLGEDLIQYVRSFDLVISFLHDPEGVVRQNLLSTGVRQVIYVSPVDPAVHATDHLLKSLERLAIYAAGAAPRLSLPAVDVAAGRARIEALGMAPHPWLALHPGSGSARKNWPARRFLELARVASERGWFPFFVLGEADESVGSALRWMNPKLPAIEGLELIDTVGVLAAADAYVGNDSGITHIAAALGLPTVALFGPTDPAIWGPRGPKVRILRAESRRLADLSPTEVWEALVSLMPSEPGQPA